MRAAVVCISLLVSLGAVVGPSRAEESSNGSDSPPLALDIQQLRQAIEVRFRLLEDLPEPFLAALPTGAQVRVEYPVRVRGHRRLWWDRRVWRGAVVATVAFDPVTGRYRCELLLDRVIVDGTEASSAQEALQWLTAPPPVRLALPSGKGQRQLLVRVRAVFASSTKWLLFPATDGTPWVEIPVEPGP